MVALSKTIPLLRSRIGSFITCPFTAHKNSWHKKKNWHTHIESELNIFQSERFRSPWVWMDLLSPSERTLRWLCCPLWPWTWTPSWGHCSWNLRRYPATGRFARPCPSCLYPFLLNRRTGIWLFATRTEIRCIHLLFNEGRSPSNRNFCASLIGSNFTSAACWDPLESFSNYKNNLLIFKEHLIFNIAGMSKNLVFSVVSDRNGNLKGSLLGLWLGRLLLLEDVHNVLFIALVVGLTENGSY